MKWWRRTKTNIIWRIDDCIRSLPTHAQTTPLTIVWKTTLLGFSFCFIIVRYTRAKKEEDDLYHACTILIIPVLIVSIIRAAFLLLRRCRLFKTARSGPFGRIIIDFTKKRTFIYYRIQYNIIVDNKLLKKYNNK